MFAAALAAAVPAAPPAAAVAKPSSGPTASALEIATLELTLAQPVLRQADAAFGGAAWPVAGSPSADAVVARYGADLAARLDVRVSATAAVRELFLVDLQQAASSGNGIGWSVEHDPAIHARRRLGRHALRPRGLRQPLGPR
jgi:hypothetical protein